MEVINALGRRKSAVARVYVTTGKGNITINGRTLEEYFKEETLRYIVRQPLNVTETLTDFDIKVNLDGCHIPRTLRDQQGGLSSGSEVQRFPHPRCPRGREEETRTARCT